MEIVNSESAAAASTNSLSVRTFVSRATSAAALPLVVSEEGAFFDRAEKKSLNSPTTRDGKEVGCFWSELIIPTTETR